MNRAVGDPVTEADLLRLRDPLRRYLVRVVQDEDELEDLLQETLLRVWEVRDRVGRSAAASYAVVTARNLLQTRERAQEVSQRHAHRLHVPPTVDGPEVEALRAEERRAAGQVLRTLRQDDVAVLSGEEGTVAQRTASRRSRLARVRARARVDYLLRLRRLQLPTAQCRPVLEALSAGDRRQQARVGAANHLLTCPVCSACAGPLVARERRMFGVLLLPVLVLLELVRQAFARAPRTSTVVAAGATAALVAGGVALQPDARVPPPVRPAPVAAPAPALPAPAAPAPGDPAPGDPAPGDPAPGDPAPGDPAPGDPGPGGPAPGAVGPSGPAPGPASPGGPDAPGVDPAALPPLDLASGDRVDPSAPGRPVVAAGVPVLSVPADEGFWVGPDTARQTFVRLRPGAGESAAQVRPGDRVSFTGSAQLITPGVADGVAGAEGLGELEQQRAYVLVAPESVVVVPG